MKLTSTQVGHHVKTIEALELTLKPNAKLVQKFKTFNNKRNKSVYDVAGAVSDQELESIVRLALREIHPELLEPEAGEIRQLDRKSSQEADGTHE